MATVEGGLERVILTEKYWHHVRASFAIIHLAPKKINMNNL